MKYEEVAFKLGKIIKNTKNFGRKKIDKAAAILSATFALPVGNKIEKSLSNIIDDTPSVYDDKIDEIYNQTHIGGGNHRLFDQSHTPAQMWEKVKEALPDDKRSEEIYNYFLSLAKDMQTIKGIPLVSIDNKQAYDVAVEKLSATFAIKKSWFVDVLSINLSEFFVTTVGVLALFFKWNKREKEEFSDLSSSLLTAATVGANPFLLIAALISLGSSFTKAKKKNEIKNFKKGSIRGILGMGSFFIASAAVSGQLFGIIFGLCVALTVRKVLKSLPDDDILEWTNNQFKKYKDVIISGGVGLGIGLMTGF